MNQNQQPGSADLPKTWQERMQAAHPTSEAQYWPDSLKCKYMSLEIDELRDAIAASRRAPSLPEVAMPDEEPEMPLRPVILRAKLRSALEDPMSADFAEVSKNTLRNVLKALAAQPAEASAQVSKSERPTEINLPGYVTLRYEARTTGDPGWLLYDPSNRLVRAMKLAEVELIEASLTAGAARQGGVTCDKSGSDIAAEGATRAGETPAELGRQVAANRDAARYRWLTQTHGLRLSPPGQTCIRDLEAMNTYIDARIDGDKQGAQGDA